MQSFVMTTMTFGTASSSKKLLEICSQMAAAWNRHAMSHGWPLVADFLDLQSSFDPDHAMADVQA